MRTIAHFLLATAGLAVGAPAMALLTVALGVSYLSNWVLPSANRQNCWMYSMWRWHRYGGYLAVRPSDGVRFAKWLPVPHVVWIKVLPRIGSMTEQYVPIKRERKEFLPWFTAYFKGHVRHVDAPHNADIGAYEKDQERV